METMLSDGNVVEKLAKLKQQDRSLWQKIKDFITELANKIRSVYDGLSPDSVEGRYVAEIKDAIEQLQKLFTEGLAEAAENYQAATEQKSTAREGEKYSISRTQNMDWGKQIQGALSGNGTIIRNDTLVVSNTPVYLVERGISQKPLAIPLRVLTKAKNGKDASHSISEKNLKKLQNGIQNSPIVIDNPARNALVFITDIYQNGKPVLAAFSKDAVFDGDNVHQATSIHIQMDVQSMLNALPRSATVYIRNENKPNAAVGVSNNLRSLAARVEFVSDSISQTAAGSQEENSSGTKFSMREEDSTGRPDGAAITRKEIAAVQSIGRKSVNDLTSEELRKVEPFARRYWAEMGVKSPFFRAWFGDWRANDRTPVRVATQRGDARGSQVNDDTGWNIQVSGKIFNETKAHTAPQNVAAQEYLPFINDIVKKAVLLDSYTLGKAKSANSLMMHSFYAVSDIGNGPEVLKLYVEEMNDPNQTGTAKRAYQLQNIERQQSGAKGSGESPSPVFRTADIESVADLFELVKQYDKNFRPKESSKVVDGDRRPKIVYHQTAKDFTAFDNSNPAAGANDSETPSGYFFKENDHDIGLDGKKQMAVYLSIMNPLHFKNRIEANAW